MYYFGILVLTLGSHLAMPLEVKKYLMVSRQPSKSSILSIMFACEFQTSVPEVDWTSMEEIPGIATLVACSVVLKNQNTYYAYRC